MIRLGGITGCGSDGIGVWPCFLDNLDARNVSG
jgi:hypothetical protein